MVSHANNDAADAVSINAADPSEVHRLVELARSFHAENAEAGYRS